ncbi:hypothetical protein F4777DRAFT_601324 [Nemania sp. FL0916]|nr:hypothetical protein F4777DRAFT_601324 [Nemania sp. FL0916]
MHRVGIPALAAAIAASLSSSGVNGQDWVPNQVNTTICWWKELRAAQLKDTAYLDGGDLYRVAGLADGSTNPPEPDPNPNGYIYKLNFSIPFDSSTNISSILTTMSKALGGGAANNFGPNYVDGAMLANDHQFYLYGGLLRDTAIYNAPDADDVLSYRASDYGLPKDFEAGFVQADLPDGMTRYVTYGGAANAPSENKAWYFGGYRSSSWGPIFEPGLNDSLSPQAVSNTLVTLDLSSSQTQKWTNSTLDPKIPSRANPSAVWVPVGEQGILVVLGGVSYPYYNTDNSTSLNAAQSKKDSPGYMSNVDIYDVAGGKWYQQPTANAPPALAMGCAVVARAGDVSSYNIYFYGGFNGLDEDQNFSDSVWVLSLPSFTWVQLSAGTPGHARAGHQCLTPYPDQMVSIGGFRSSEGGLAVCIDGLVEVFNLTSGEWLNSYDPSAPYGYGVPEKVHAIIGGDYSGGATVATPVPSGWADTGLADVFATKYDTSKIMTYYPYNSQAPGNETRPPYKNSGGGGTPSWVAPVLGVVLGLIFVTAIVVGILLWRRRKLLLKKKDGSDGTSGDGQHHFIRTWLNDTGEKAATSTTDDPTSRYDMESRNETPGRVVISPEPEMTQPTIHEQPPVAELDAPTHIAELSGDSLPYDQVISKHTQLHSPTSPHSRSRYSGSAAIKHPSLHTGSVSHEQPSSLSSSQVGIRGDSPSLGNPSPMRTPPPNREVSDLSRISEHHMSHLRNLSGGTVSTTSNAGSGSVHAPSPPPPIQTGFHSRNQSQDQDHDDNIDNDGLISPPSAYNEHEAGDYLMGMHRGPSPIGQAGPSRSFTAGSLRRSVFRENADDMGDNSTEGQKHANTQ